MRQEIIENNYLHIPNFINSKDATQLALEFKDFSKKLAIYGEPLKGDFQAPNSNVIYNFLPFVRLLVEKVPEVSEILGEKVLPTYTYARIYKKGSELLRHRDRPACEISLTLNLAKDCDWPIYFERPDGSETSIELEPGDAVMYLGCQADHWRGTFFGNEHTQVFMHYVRSYGSKSWAFFDKSQQQPPTISSESLPVTVY